MKKVNERTQEIFPRVTPINKTWVKKTAKQFSLNTSELIDSLLTYSRKNLVTSKMKVLFGTGAGK